MRGQKTPKAPGKARNSNETWPTCAKTPRFTTIQMSWTHKYRDRVDRDYKYALLTHTKYIWGRTKYYTRLRLSVYDSTFSDKL